MQTAVKCKCDEFYESGNHVAIQNKVKCTVASLWYLESSSFK